MLGDHVVGGEEPVPYVSVTRLRARGPRFLPRLALHTWRSARQIRSSEGFIGGYLAIGPRITMWTVTVWRDVNAMRGFRNTSWHLKAMPALLDSCDEAAVTSWTSEDTAVPEPEAAAERMATGRPSKVRNPSPAHASGQTWPDRQVPRRGPTLMPNR
jgi:hypothetical protein